MHAAKSETLILLSLVLALSGCYGCCADPYAGCGPYGYGGYDPYDDCVGLAGAGYEYGYGGAYPPPCASGYGPAGYRDRLTLRERILARREARALRRDGRRSGYRHGRRGGIGCDTCFDNCWDGGWIDPCCCECGPCVDCGPCFDSCGPCIDGCVPMSAGCSDCGPCTDCGTYVDGFGGIETYDSGIIDSGMIDSGYIDSPEMSCAGGHCPLGPEWEATSVPYSHEGYLEAPGDYSPEPVPHPMEDNQRESRPVPPSVQEGTWEGDSEVIRSPDAAAPVHQTMWIPPQF